MSNWEGAKTLKDIAEAYQNIYEKKAYEVSKDQDQDGDNDFADVRIARMIASGVPREKAIAMTKNKSYNKEEIELDEKNDYEHSMIRVELKTAMEAINRLMKKMSGEGDVEAWVQSKITRAADYLEAAANYIDSGESKVK